MFKFLKNLISGVVNALRKALGLAPIPTPDEVEEMEARREEARQREEISRAHKERVDYVTEMISCAWRMRYKMDPQYGDLRESDILYLESLSEPALKDLAAWTISPSKVVDYFDRGWLNGVAFRFPRPCETRKRFSDFAKSLAAENDKAGSRGGSGGSKGPKRSFADLASAPIAPDDVALVNPESVTIEELFEMAGIEFDPPEPRRGMRR